MKYDDAVTLVTKVCSGYNGNLAEHKLIQEALAMLLSKPTQVKVPAKVSKKSKKK